MSRENICRQAEKTLMDGLEYAKNSLEYDRSSGYILGHIFTTRIYCPRVIYREQILTLSQND